MPDRLRFPKSTCCIQGCQRWSTLFPGEWLCARHWRMAPARTRRLLRRIWKGERELNEQYDAAGHGWTRDQWLQAERLRRLGAKLWERAVRAVTLAAAGL